MKFLLVSLFLVAAAIAASVPPSTSAPTKNPNTLKCLICKGTVIDVEKSLGDQTKSFGEQEVDLICKNVVPFPTAEQYCEEYGEKEVDAIVDGILAKESPSVICGKIGFC